MYFRIRLCVTLSKSEILPLRRLRITNFAPKNRKKMLNTIGEAIEDIKKGKLLIVVDDEDRENEGDFVTAARNVTPEVVNFMSTHGRGLICASITEERCAELQLQPMVTNNTS